MVGDLLVDLDGTVVQYDFPKLLQKWFGVTLPTSALYAHSVEDCLGVTRAEVSKMFEVECFAEPQLIVGAVPTLERLGAEGYKLNVFSNRLHYMTQEELTIWLQGNRIPFSAVVTSKTLPSYVVAHIDDNPEKLMSVRDFVEVRHSLLFSQPWNKRCLNITGKLERVKSWQAVEEKLNGV